MTPEQSIKVQLVLLAKYLDVSISDDHIRLYAADLMDIGPEGLAKAIVALRQDESVWSGRFPLPAKIKSYLIGTVEDRASLSATKIMDTLRRLSPLEGLGMLSPIEKEAALGYGVGSISDRTVGQSPIVFSQLKQILQSLYSRATREAISAKFQLETQNGSLPRYLEEVTVEAPRPEESASGEGEGRLLSS